MALNTLGFICFSTETAMLIYCEFESVIGERCFEFWCVMSSQKLGKGEGKTGFLSLQCSPDPSLFSNFIVDSYCF